VGEAQLLHQKIDNVRSALAAAEDMAWADLAGPSSSPNKHFHTSPSASTLTLPEQGSEGAVLRLRRMLAWEEQMASAITERTSSLRDRGMDGAVKYRKLVSLCTRTPVDQVDGVSPDLCSCVWHRKMRTSRRLRRWDGVHWRVGLILMNGRCLMAS
jgi:hypothetical protein